MKKKKKRKCKTEFKNQEQDILLDWSLSMLTELLTHT